jgi:hypothetical protein
MFGGRVEVRMRSPSALIIAEAPEGEQRRGMCFLARRLGGGQNGDRRGGLRGTGANYPTVRNRKSRRE